MTKKFPKIEDTKSQTQEAWKTPSEINIKCAHTQAYHILTAESEYKEGILNESRRGKQKP